MSRKLDVVTITGEEYDKLLDDANILDWVLPILTGVDSDSADKKTMALAQALMSGLDGREAIAKAMDSFD